MAAPVVYPALDSLPGSLSRRWIGEVLRRDLGFHGCVFADDLNMAGVAAFGDIAQRCRLALAAGCDVLPICNNRSSVELALGALGADADAVSAASRARLVRMRARGEPGDCRASPQWRETAARIEGLSTPPPLVLTEGES
jgi:beta-N-acetylhexosaminidase